MSDRDSRDFHEGMGGLQGPEVQGCLSGGHAQGSKEGKKKSLQLQTSISECSGLLHSSLSAVHSNMPLQQEGGKMDKLDKTLAHPSTGKVAGVNGEGR